MRTVYKCCECGGFFIDDESLQNAMEYVTERLGLDDRGRYLCPDCVEKFEKARRMIPKNA